LIRSSHIQLAMLSMDATFQFALHYEEKPMSLGLIHEARWFVEEIWPRPKPAISLPPPPIAWLHLAKPATVWLAGRAQLAKSSAAFSPLRSAK